MTGASDIATGDWVDRRVPAALRPYLRLARVDRPIGTWLLLFPGWWSIALAAPPGVWPDIEALILFAIGALVMRGAGCTVNDIADRDFDARVARTANRPLASGALSVRQALVFLVLQLLAGLAILLQFPPFAIGLGTASLVLVAAYPFMKRITWWPQAFLGLTFNWGALLGWAAVTGELAWAAVLLYVGGIFWTLFYDTIYAHQDKTDDMLVGVKSTALRLGAQTKPWLVGFAAAALAFWACALIAASSGIIALAGLFGCAAHLAWQWRDVDLDNTQDCLRKFRSNRFIGWILFAGIVLDRLLA
ncbi:4-hydroxybenzoate polyprenyltransferase [Dongia mobilis]|uniref:4-hydroxybenzoate octaprenyltransferase n=1 Tax=Dongia mobilis TaxID=578943 RepID=A0A4R6WVX3_9PROT|nr:4-hydroxybenzoate octaprenyltransferase [Dongia mobilis]TDQ84184.1 4-hydroxybenzoate polyprenyltransferase [Dongia mobilis]